MITMLNENYKLGCRWWSWLNEWSWFYDYDLMMIKTSMMIHAAAWWSWLDDDHDVDDDHYFQSWSWLHVHFIYWFINNGFIINNNFKDDQKLIIIMTWWGSWTLMMIMAWSADQASMRPRWLDDDQNLTMADGRMTHRWHDDAIMTWRWPMAWWCQVFRPRQPRPGTLFRDLPNMP